jgi:sugar-specific transcriptional regulator TrmB
MESDDKIIQTFRDFGIKTNATKAYLALLRNGPSSATEISKFSGVPQPRTYDILHYLNQRGFVVVQKVGRRNIFQASNPETVLDRLMGQLRSKDNYLRGSLKGLEGTGEKLSPEIWLVKGIYNITAKIDEIINKAKTELLLAGSTSLFNNWQVNLLHEAVRKGVSVSIILYTDPNETNSHFDFKEDPFSIRQREALNATMAMADYEFGLIRSHFKSIFGSSEYAVYTEDLGLLHIMDYYFNNFLWVPSKILAEPELSSKNFTYIWRATEFSEAALKAGKKIQAIIHGKKIKTGETIDLKGEVSQTIISHPSPQVLPMYSLVIKTTDDKTYKVGGRGAVVEDIEAFYISLSTE